MLKETEKTAIRQVLAQIKAHLREYKSRRAQREMFAAVARVLAQARRNCLGPFSKNEGRDFQFHHCAT